MSQQRITGIYKKTKTYNQGNSMSQWDSYSRRKEQSSFTKKKQGQQDMQWIGTQSTPQRPQHIQNSYITQSFQAKHLTAKSSMMNQIPKAPAQLIQDILKGLVSNNKLNTVNPYYSEESEEKLTQILTNQNKLQAFISELEIQMSQADISVVKNYQMLIILLKHISKSDVEVKHSTKGLELNFNRNLMIKQQNQIERLEKKIKEKDQNIKEIIQQYESVIRNFNDVIEKLLEERTNHGHHGSNHHSYSNYNQKNSRGY